MQVIASPEVRAYVHDHGGALYVSRRPAHCCGGTTFLSATTKPPPDLADYRELYGDGVTVFFRSATERQPERLVLALEGHGKRPAAYWDGCAFVV